jgi:hypothetical protein
MANVPPGISTVSSRIQEGALVAGARGVLQVARVVASARQSEAGKNRTDFNPWVDGTTE